MTLTVMSLLLSVLILGNIEQASAQTLCAEGIQSGVTCEIEGAAPTQGANGLECADDFQVDGTRCVRYELVNGVALSCAVGTLELDECVETGPAPTRVCPTSATVVEIGGECYELVPGTGGSTCPADTLVAPDGQSCRRPVDAIIETSFSAGTCPDGFTTGNVNAVDLCSRFELATESHPSCEPALGTEGNCYRLQAPVRSCANGELAGDVCAIEGDLPVNGPATCAVSADVFLDVNFCYNLVSPPVGGDGSCVAPDVADPGGMCRTAYPLTAGQLVCQDDFALLNGRCFQLVEAAADVFCAVALDPFGLCRVADAGRQSELQCLEPAQVLQGTGCITSFVATAESVICPPGFVDDLAGRCTRTVSGSQYESDCPNGARGVENGCYIFVAKGPPQSSTGYPGPFPVQPAVSPASGSAPGNCPVGSVLALGLNCRKPVANAAGAYYCTSPHAQLSGRDCVTTTTMLSIDADTGCPTDFLLAGGICSRTVLATLSDLGCPVNTFGSAGSCYRVIQATDVSGTVCRQGQLTVDATACYVNARLVPQDDTIECPDDFSPDGSLGGMCAQFEPASQGPATCPPGASGVPGDCYSLVARGPAGPGTCEDATAVVQGIDCVITDGPPTRSLECPVGANVYLDDGGFCYQLISKPSIALVCDATAASHNAAPYDLVDGRCTFIPSFAGQPVPAGGFTCPSVFLGSSMLVGAHEPNTDGSEPTIGACVLTGTGSGPCFVPDVEDPNGISCRTEFDLTLGPLRCEAPFGIVNGECTRYEDAVFAPVECPDNSLEDDNGDCRKPVADAAGAYFCEDVNAALNGTSCVFTEGAIITPNPPLAVCDLGERTVDTNDQVTCILGNPVVQNLCPSNAQTQPDGVCAVPVGDAVGSYYCEDPGALQQYEQWCLLTADFSLSCTTAQAVAGDCGRPALWQCPADYSVDDSLLGSCTRYEPASETAGGTYVCLDATATLNGKSCVFVTRGADQCNPISGACPQTTQVSSCPALADVFADGNECFQHVSFEGAACPANAEPINATSLCGKLLLAEDQALGCAAGFNLVGDDCLRTSDPAGLPNFDCAQSGLGTAACNQVIANAQAAPGDELVSLRRTGLAYAACAGGTGTYTVTAANGSVVAQGAMREYLDGNYSASYAAPSAGSYQIAVAVACPGGDTMTKTRQLGFTYTPCLPSGFVDVPGSVYYDDPVAWAACVEVTKGTSTTTFSPNSPVTRAQMATFLWRYAGEPQGADPHGFADVPSGAYFDEPVAWLKASGITTGTSDTTFSPYATVTRAQMAAFVWRFANRPDAGSHPFVDVPSESYFADAVAWMSATGVTTGTSATTYSPYSELTRGQAVTFLWRLALEPEI